MKTNKQNPSLNKSLLCAVLALITVTFVTAQAQFQQRNIQQAQARIRERMIREQGGRSPEVRFTDNGNFESISNSETRVRGTGTYYRDRNDQGREFTYESVFSVRGGDLRSLNYNFRGDGNWNGGGNNNAQTIYCASDDGRRNNCPANTRGGVRLVRQQSGSACVEGRTWGYDRSSIWVDRGCRADFEVGRNGGGNWGIGGGNGGGNGGGFGGGIGGDRPNGQVRYNGSIMNRESNKGLDVANQSRQDGANIQQWDYAGQANQNWDVIDLGNGEVAIVSQLSGHALTVQGGNDRNAANIIQRRWRNVPQQRWRLENVGGGWFKVRNVDTGKCLDVTDHSRQNGTNIQQWDCADQANQQWRLGR